MTTGRATRVDGGARLILAHDYLIFLRGAERTFLRMASAWPTAPIHTLAYSAASTEGRFTGRDIRTSFLEHAQMRRWNHRAYLPLLTRAIDSIEIGQCDALVSSSFGFAHGIRAPEGAAHVCYCHTPFRHAWHERESTLASTTVALRPALARVLDRYRRWDLGAAARVSTYVANSRTTAERIGELYGREAEVVHPPVDVDRFSPGEPEDYFLFVGELVAHKRPAVALEAARLAGRRLVLVGGGPELRRLRTQYPEATFLGRITDDELASVYARARALVLPNIEEFGIVAVEAQAAGRPVLALGRGGARETVLDGRTGVLVEHAAVGDFAEAMCEVDFEAFDPHAARENAGRFSNERFDQEIKAVVARETG